MPTKPPKNAQCRRCKCLFREADDVVRDRSGWWHRDCFVMLACEYSSYLDNRDWAGGQDPLIDLIDDGII